MKYLINWSDIKDGHKGFEKLAVKYVQEKYDERFEHTSDTRDGNKDAVLHKDEYTLVFGFNKTTVLLKNGGWRQSIAKLRNVLLGIV